MAISGAISGDDPAGGLFETPDLLCDCHLHVYGPEDKYRYVEDANAKPEEATVERYREVQARLGTARAVLVQPSAFGHDHTCLLDGLAELSRSPDGGAPDCARAIGAVSKDVEDAELEDLREAGLIGARFLMLAGTEAYTWDEADRLAWRIHDVGWDVELQMDGSDLHEVEQRLRDWPGRIVIDHIGKFMRTQILDQRGFKALTRLIDRDKVWVKLSAPYESSREGKADDPVVATLARALADWAPERMIWGSNWPHPTVLDDPPDDRTLLRLLSDWVPEEARRTRILLDNPAELYGFARHG